MATPVTLASFVSAHPQGTAIAIKLQPRSSKDEISGVIGSELKVSVHAAPVDSAANEALIRLLADRLDCPKGNLQILRGKTSRHKVVLARGVDAATVHARLT